MSKVLNMRHICDMSDDMRCGEKVICVAYCACAQKMRAGWRGRNVHKSNVRQVAKFGTKGSKKAKMKKIS